MFKHIFLCFLVSLVYNSDTVTSGLKSDELPDYISRFAAEGEQQISTSSEAKPVINDEQARLFKTALKKAATDGDSTTVEQMLSPDNQKCIDFLTIEQKSIPQKVAESIGQAVFFARKAEQPDKTPEAIYKDLSLSDVYKMLIAYELSKERNIRGLKTLLQNEIYYIFPFLIKLFRDEKDHSPLKELLSLKHKVTADTIEAAIYMQDHNYVTDSIMSKEYPGRLLESAKVAYHLHFPRWFSDIPSSFAIKRLLYWTGFICQETLKDAFGKATEIDGIDYGDFILSAIQDPRILAETHLLRASRYGFLKSIRWVLKLCIKPQSKVLLEALNASTSQGHREITKLLIDAGASFETLLMSMDSTSSLFNHACYESHLYQTSKIDSFWSSSTAHRYVRNKLPEMPSLSELYEMPSFQNFLDHSEHNSKLLELTRSPLKRTPLIWATLCAHEAKLEAIKNCNPPRWYLHARDKAGFSALDYAAALGNDRLANYLLKSLVYQGKIDSTSLFLASNYAARNRHHFLAACMVMFYLGLVQGILSA